MFAARGRQALAAPSSRQTVRVAGTVESVDGHVLAVEVGEARRGKINLTETSRCSV